MDSRQKLLADLAINGGAKVRTAPWPGRSHYGVEEKAAVDALFDEAIASGNATGYNGREEEAYCREFAEFMGGGYADGVNSGTTSVYVALRALNLEPWSEVIVGCVTDPGGIMPVVLMNCIPMVADAAPGCYNSGPEQVEELITPLTSAILIAHIGGEPADIEGIVRVARKHNLPVVEDCSQSHGAKLHGKYVGTFGDIAAFSTMFGKHHCTGGQGGVVFTRRENLYWAARRVADRGKPFNLPAGSTNCVASLNCNLNEIGSAIGRAQLRKLPAIVQSRQRVAELLRQELESLKSIKIPSVIPGGEHSYWWWRLEVDCNAITCSKADYCAALIAEGLPVNPKYSGAMPHSFDWFCNRTVFGSSKLPWSSPLYSGEGDREFPCPNANTSMDTQFNLTIFESWGEAEIADVVAAFKKVDAAMSK